MKIEDITGWRKEMERWSKIFKERAEWIDKQLEEIE